VELISVFVLVGFISYVHGAIKEYTMRHQLQLIASGMVQVEASPSKVGMGEWRR
jgi:hypothetical protein